MNSLIERIRSDERGLSTLEWIGVVTAVLVLVMLVPQIRSALDVLYENLVGKNNVGPDGEPQPGVLVRGIIVGVGSLVVFVGSIWLINYTNLGRRLAFLITGASFFGFLAIVGLLYTLYAPRGLRPTLVEGLNAFQLRILPGALMLGSLILFVMFVAAMSRYEAEQGN
ncbi:MAG: hypothetical protein V3S62_09715 [Acidimicrobiia bacterium]